MGDGASPCPLRLGVTVLVSGLQAAKQFNGEEGICEGEDPTTGRWRVRLESGELKAFRSENLTVISATADPEVVATMRITVPPGAAPGSKLRCETPDGETILLTVPSAAPAGTVLSVRRNSAALRWECGDPPARDAALAEARQPPLRVGEAVEGRFCDGRWYPATIMEVLGGGASFLVNWQDGDPQDRIKDAEDIRRPGCATATSLAAPAGGKRMSGMEALAAAVAGVLPEEVVKYHTPEEQAALASFRYGDGLYAHEEIAKAVTETVGAAALEALRLPGCVAFWRSTGSGDTWFAGAKYEYEFPNGTYGLEWYERI